MENLKKGWIKGIEENSIFSHTEAINAVNALYIDGVKFSDLYVTVTSDPKDVIKFLKNNESQNSGYIGEFYQFEKYSYGIDVNTLYSDPMGYFTNEKLNIKNSFIALINGGYKETEGYSEEYHVIMYNCL